MASSQPVARQDIDYAGGLIGTGAMTVFVNGDTAKWHCATEGSVIKGSPNAGDIIKASDVTVFAENKKVAIKGAVTASGQIVGNASENVFAGNGK